MTARTIDLFLNLVATKQATRIYSDGASVTSVSSKKDRERLLTTDIWRKPKGMLRRMVCLEVKPKPEMMRGPKTLVTERAEGKISASAEDNEAQA